MADPLLALIQEYRKQLAINDTTECRDIASEEAVAEATYRPPYDRLRTNPPVPTSYEGVVAAIQLVADEEETCGGQPDLTVNVLRAALGFLEGVDHPDAKLIELGRQFKVAKAKARKLNPARNASFDAYETAKRAACIPDLPRDQSPEQKALEGKIYCDTGHKDACEAVDAAYGECVRLMKAIHRTKASTLEGFSVKAAAVAFDQAEFNVDVPEPSDVVGRQLYRLARDMAKVAKAHGGSPCA